MEAKSHTLEVNLRHRFFTLGELNDQTPAIWIVCHGYGQLAPYFIRHFQVLADAGHFVIAPEGLSRFYLEGFSGRVGASWMTKEDRETDIHNNVLYLSEVCSQMVKDHPAPLKLLGFSQGVATLCRWVFFSEPVFQQLILWAGVFPDDIAIPPSSSLLTSRKVSLVFGDEDPFLNESKKEEQLQLFREMNIQPEIIEFKGKHEIDQNVLKRHFLS